MFLSFAAVRAEPSSIWQKKSQNKEKKREILFTF